MQSNLQKINFWFLSILIVFIPFQALLNGFFEYRFGFSPFWLLHWYEPVLIVLLILTILVNPKMEKPLSAYIITLLSTGILSTLLYQSPSKGVEGFRFTLAGILFFALAYLSGLSIGQKKYLLKTYLFVSIVIASWALVEKLLPGRYWSAWSILSPDLYWGYGWHFVGTFKQTASVLGGPNQLASFLLPAFFITLFLLIRAYGNNEKKVYLYSGLTLLFGLIIFLTLSRSAILGFSFGVFAVPFLTSKNIWLKRAMFFAAIISVAVISLLYISGNELITHGKSQAGHAAAMTQSFDEISNRFQYNQIKFVLGSGLGSAGPLAIKYSEGIVSESWYLQLFLELGLIGVLLWLIFISSALVVLFKDRNYSLLFGLIAVSVTALFLHTWADNPALTYTLFTLLGISFNKGSTKWQEF